MRRSIVFLLLSLLVLGATSLSHAGSIDTFTNASVSNYYPPAASIEELTALVTFSGVVVVSTTNPDQSPNAAVIIPAIFENQYVILQTAPNQTMENLARDGRAVISIFIPFPDEEKNTGKYGDIRKYGARLICEVLPEGSENTEALARYNKLNEARPLAEGHRLLKIVGILPIG